MKKWANELNRLSKSKWLENTWKKFSLSLARKEMQIKTTSRFHLTPIWIATIKSTIENKFLGGCREKGALIYCWWECRLVQPL
jgi:hypothetical protein